MAPSSPLVVKMVGMERRQLSWQRGDEGILVKVLTSWWELHARGRKLQGTSVAREALVKRLGVDERWWGEMKLV
jgi:hypothetical protein